MRCAKESGVLCLYSYVYSSLYLYLHILYAADLPLSRTLHIEFKSKVYTERCNEGCNAPGREKGQSEEQIELDLKCVHTKLLQDSKYKRWCTKLLKKVNVQACVKI